MMQGRSQEMAAPRDIEADARGWRKGTGQFRSGIEIWNRQLAVIEVEGGAAATTSGK